MTLPWVIALQEDCAWSEKAYRRTSTFAADPRRTPTTRTDLRDQPSSLYFAVISPNLNLTPQILGIRNFVQRAFSLRENSIPLANESKPVVKSSMTSACRVNPNTRVRKYFNQRLSYWLELMVTMGQICFAGPCNRILRISS